MPGQYSHFTTWRLRGPVLVSLTRPATHKSEGEPWAVEAERWEAGLLKVIGPPEANLVPELVQCHRSWTRTRTSFPPHAQLSCLEICRLLENPANKMPSPPWRQHSYLEHLVGDLGDLNPTQRQTLVCSVLLSTWHSLSSNSCWTVHELPKFFSKENKKRKKMCFNACEILHHLLTCKSVQRR